LLLLKRNSSYFFADPFKIGHHNSTTGRNEVVRNLMLLLILILGMGRHRGRATGMLPTWHLDTAGNNVLGEPENPPQQQPASEEDAKHQNGTQPRANKLRTQSLVVPRYASFPSIIIIH